ncbi:hypothetical protein ACFOTA_23505 [Chitinophaga sp. GCM10012297]|uniref:Uncharacterized protein n=1 Tax=Chitinophaga chungangae TaxID=2821488 RepID=A0ABS3YKI5_9BACT|nr:hypothetical protein [Chitinophaga chungangae]MBO9155196.1 hypothetical protein [Chitinophaga chungangae]
MQTIFPLETASPKISKPFPRLSPRPAVALVNIHQPGAMALAVQTIHRHPILIQLPSVYALLAAPTTEGARQLDDCKMRLAGKNYGTAIGSLRSFLAQARQETLPAQFNTGKHFSGMTGSFIRLQFRNAGFHSKTIRSGTHQGLLLDGVLRELFRQVENSFRHYAPDEIWEGKNYGGPLCTSCNISGHHEGSITALDKAMKFAQQRNIPFIITATAAGEKGSYPIFGFAEDGVRIHREGPGMEHFKQQVPLALRRF